jgi:hypothetical protein
MNKSLSNDELYQIMIHADIDTITSICLTNDISYCHDGIFWKFIFHRDNIPILSKLKLTTFSGWRKEYRKVTYAMNQSKYIMDVLKPDKEIEFDYSSDKMNFKFILPFHLRSVMFNFTANYATFDKLRMGYHNGKYYSAGALSDNEIYDILTLIFYYHPDIPYKIIDLEYNESDEISEYSEYESSEE